MGIPLTVTTNIDLDPWTDLDRDQLIYNPGGVTASVTRIGLLPDGTEQGRATVMFELKLPDGTPVIAETTWRLFNAAARALAASPVAEMEDL